MNILIKIYHHYIDSSFRSFYERQIQLENLLQKLIENHKQLLETAEIFSLKPDGDRIARTYVQRAEGVKDTEAVAEY